MSWFSVGYRAPVPGDPGHMRLTYINLRSGNRTTINLPDNDQYNPNARYNPKLEGGCFANLKDGRIAIR